MKLSLIQNENDKPTIPAPPPPIETDDEPTQPMKRTELNILMTVCAAGRR